MRSTIVLSEPPIPQSPAPATPPAVTGFLSSPAGLALIISTFILLSGGVPVAVNQVLMHRSLHEQAEQTAASYAHAVVQGIETIFSHTDPILSDLRSLAASAAAGEAFKARTLSALVAGRTGVSSAGWALSDGTYDGIRLGSDGWMYVHAAPDPTGRVVAKERR